MKVWIIKLSIISILINIYISRLVTYRKTKKTLGNIDAKLLLETIINKEHHCMGVLKIPEMTDKSLIENSNKHSKSIKKAISIDVNPSENLDSCVCIGNNNKYTEFNLENVIDDVSYLLFWHSGAEFYYLMDEKKKCYLNQIMTINSNEQTNWDYYVYFLNYNSNDNKNELQSAYNKLLTHTKFKNKKVDSNILK